MGFPSAITMDIAAGNVGEFAFDGPMNAQPLILNSADAAQNVIGRAFTHKATEGEAQAGGIGTFAGILANPKAFASFGTTAGGPLAATLTVPNGVVGDFVQGTPGIFVTVPGNCNIGDQVIFAQATGVLSTQPAGTAPGAGNSLIPGATVVRYERTGGGAGLAVIALNGPVLGTQAAA